MSKYKMIANTFLCFLARFCTADVMGLDELGMRADTLFVWVCVKYKSHNNGQIMFSCSSEHAGTGDVISPNTILRRKDL